MAIILDDKAISAFIKKLRNEERSDATVEKYVYAIRAFSIFLNGRAANKHTAIEFKSGLKEKNYAPETVNGYLAAINKLFLYHRHPDWRVKYLVVQQQNFREDKKNLSKKEYLQMLHSLKRNGKNERLVLVMETICSTGIRVSELKYITVESLSEGKAVIVLKGKIRTILLPEQLCKKLVQYAMKKGYSTGSIFKTKDGKCLDRRHIWSDMKRACKKANVERTKVYPHNLRHLFARTFYEASKNLVQLSHILGHSSINTTKIYLISTGDELRYALDRLRLIA